MKIELVEHRGQYRIELSSLIDTQKTELIKGLAEDITTWGQWRFTNQAIWINENATDPELVLLLKLLRSSGGHNGLLRRNSVFLPVHHIGWGLDEWLLENTGEKGVEFDWSLELDDQMSDAGFTYYFKNDYDAMGFKLTWQEAETTILEL